MKATEKQNGLVCFNPVHQRGESLSLTRMAYPFAKASADLSADRMAVKTEETKKDANISDSFTSFFFNLRWIVHLGEHFSMSIRLVCGI